MEGPKLTKKQRKGLAFRQGKGRKAKEEGSLLDVPEADVIEETEVPERPAAEEGSRGKKRKRAEVDVDETPIAVVSEPKKKRKGAGGEAKVVASGKEPSRESKAEKQSDEGSGDAKRKTDKSKRYILFVGNLPPNVTTEQISNHFSSCPTAPIVRLRTPAPPKAGAQQPYRGTGQAARPKVFAFLEFVNPGSLQSALKLHRSNLGGKLINVELTVGGGGKGAGRQEKIKAKREAVRAQGNVSGVPQPAVKRAGEYHQRPTAAASRPTRPPRPQGTGANAITVG